MSDQRLKIIHVIDAFSQANHGIIEAALGTAQILSDEHEIDSEIWFPQISNNSHDVDLRGATSVELTKRDIANPAGIVNRQGYTAENTLISTHGCWQFPTVVGSKLKKVGFNWIYTPHGMLEPWSLSQKHIRKKAYWQLREQPLANKAIAIRATSVPELKNLKKLFEHVKLATHGIDCSIQSRTLESDGPIRVLFMGRLHPKKGASNLVKAWQQSLLNSDPKFQLIIVGSDNGDLQHLNAAISQDNSSNIALKAPIFGTKKLDLFASSQFFALPSHSEGFPMALLEGMGAGLIPMISDGCNLPAAIEAGFAIQITPEVAEITKALNVLVGFSNDEIVARQIETLKFMAENYSLVAIARQQADFYRSLIS